MITLKCTKGENLQIHSNIDAYFVIDVVCSLVNTSFPIYCMQQIMVSRGLFCFLFYNSSFIEFCTLHSCDIVLP